MKSRKLFGLLLLAATAAGCGDEKKEDATTFAVSTHEIVLAAEAGAAGTFDVTAGGAWTAETEGAGFAVEPAGGTGNATVRVTAPTANEATEVVTLGTIFVRAAGIAAPERIAVSRQAAASPDPGPKPDPEPDPKPEPQPDLTLTVDFALGPGIAEPALPSASSEALSGRHEYLIAGYPFALYADGDDNGKFYWTDNSQYFPMDDPCKGLFFSKTGAYVEFPAPEGRTLRQIGYWFNNGAGELPELDITTPDDAFVEYSLDFADDGKSMTYTLLAPEANVTYRLIAVNRKNAQVSKFVLVYTGTE